MAVGARARRFGLALSALAIAAWLFRPEIAQGIVLRGDDYLYRTQTREAIIRYARALSIDPDNAAAADRLVFVKMEARTPSSLDEAVSVATAYLRKHPDDPAILADRALCRLIQRRYRAARADFVRVASLARDPRYFTFAGWAALRAHDRASAHRLWRAALFIDPGFRPAKRALDRRL